MYNFLLNTAATLVAMIIFTTQLNAQNIAWKKYFFYENSYTRHVINTSDGGFLFGGGAGPSLTNDSISGHGFVVKLDSNGNQKWKCQIPWDTLGSFVFDIDIVKLEENDTSYFAYLGTGGFSQAYGFAEISKSGKLLRKYVDTSSENKLIVLSPILPNIVKDSTIINIDKIIWVKDHYIRDSNSFFITVANKFTGKIIRREEISLNVPNIYLMPRHLTITKDGGYMINYNNDTETIYGYSGMGVALIDKDFKVKWNVYLKDSIFYVCGAFPTEDGGFVTAVGVSDSFHIKAFTGQIYIAMYKFNNKQEIEWKKKIPVEKKPYNVAYPSVTLLYKREDGGYYLGGRNIGTIMYAIDKNGNKEWEREISVDTTGHITQFLETPDKGVLVLAYWEDVFSLTKIKRKIKSVEIENKEEIEKDRIIIEPNIVSNKLIIRNEGNFMKSNRIQIVNSQGKIVKELEIEDEYSEHDISNLPSGIYVAVANVDGKLLRNKFCVYK